MIQLYIYIYILFQILFHYKLLFFRAAILFTMEFSQVPSVRVIVFIEGEYIVGVEIVKVRGHYWWPR